MSDQFHKYDDYEEINDESDKFTQGIHLHNQFKKSVGFANEFLRKKLRRRKIIRITSLLSLISIIIVGAYLWWVYPPPPPPPPPIVADKVLDIIVCEKMEAPDASKASDALIKEFGDKFNANIYSGSGVKSIPVSANLKTELYNVLCNNTAAVAPEALSKLLKQMIYSPKDAKLPSNMVVLNNLTEYGDYFEQTGILLLSKNDLIKSDYVYKKIIFLSNDQELNTTSNDVYNTKLIKNKEIRKY